MLVICQNIALVSYVAQFVLETVEPLDYVKTLFSILRQNIYIKNEILDSFQMKQSVWRGPFRLAATKNKGWGEKEIKIEVGSKGKIECKQLSGRTKTRGEFSKHLASMLCTATSQSHAVESWPWPFLQINGSLANPEQSGLFSNIKIQKNVSWLWVCLCCGLGVVTL